MFNSRAGYADAIAGSFTTPTYSESPPSPEQRNGSITRITTQPMTYSQGLGVDIQRRESVASDDEIIMVTVKLSNKSRRQSYDDALPERPRKRGFLQRVSTRILPPAEEDKWKAVKMPRGEYKRHFLRDRDGNYAGSEPQREWDEADIHREYGHLQDAPIGTSGAANSMYGRMLAANCVA